MSNKPREWWLLHDNKACCDSVCKTEAIAKDRALQDDSMTHVIEYSAYEYEKQQRLAREEYWSQDNEQVVRERDGARALAVKYLREGDMERARSAKLIEALKYIWHESPISNSAWLGAHARNAIAKYESKDFPTGAGNPGPYCPKCCGQPCICPHSDKETK